MISIEGGRSCLYQWDINQRLRVDHPDVTEVHFSNTRTQPALICEVYEEDGARYANIPNILLQQPLSLLAHGCCGECVHAELIIRVVARAKPADYVYTETELLSFEKLMHRAEEAVRVAEASVAQATAGAERAEAAAQELEDSVEQVAQNAEAIGQLSEEIGDVDAKISVGTLTDGFTMRDGAVYASDAFACSGYVAIPDGSRHINIQCSIVDNAAFIICDDRKNVVLYIDSTNVDEYGLANTTTPQIVDIALPAGAAYFRANFLKNRYDSLDDLYATVTVIGPVVNEIIGLKRTAAQDRERLLTLNGYVDDLRNVSPVYVETPADYTPIAGAFVWNSSGKGVITQQERYSYTELYHLKTGDYVRVTSSDPSGSAVARVSRWVDEETCVEVLNTGTQDVSAYTYVAQNDVYLRFSFYTSSGIEIVCGTPNTSERYDAIVKSIVVKMPDTDFWAYAAWKILCIGDSLTSGASFDEAWGEMASPGASIDQNYPRILGRMIDAEVANAGFGGYSASTWYNDKISGYNFADYDTFIIWLGTNHGLTDTLDTDVEPYENYADYANTETGYYCKIIETIKAQNNSCLIVLVKVFASQDDYALTNVVIDKIATRYKLPVIDNSDLGVTNHPELHSGVNNPHFGKAGNIVIANRVKHELGKYFNDYPLRCEYGLTPRTN